MTPEIQAILQDVAGQESQETTGKLHKAVKELDRAKKALASAEKAKFQFYGSWKDFLAKSVVTWDGYTKDFAAKDASLNDKVAKAQQALALAKRSLSSLKSTEEIQTVEDSEEEAKPRSSSGGQKLHEGLVNMTSMLQGIQAEAELLESEPPSKVRRVTTKQEKEDDMDVGGDPSKRSHPSSEAPLVTAPAADLSGDTSGQLLATPNGKVPAPFA